MPMPRCQLVSLETTSYYHVISRCVRRQHLCGRDHHTGRDFSHRRDWIRARIFELQAVFAVDVCAYAVMNNHFHLVLRIDQQRALDWDEVEVARRWMKLFGGNPLVRSLVSGESLSDAQLQVARTKISEYRKRLFDLSWFMRCLNEPIARMANAEDNATGRFWEGRFKSQALLDETALIAAMAYVDLNPVRAGIAETPEESNYTSAQQRILETQSEVVNSETNELPEDLRLAIGRLMPFRDQAPENPELSIPYELQDYLDLVDWSGRAIAPGKRGSIPPDLPLIFDRLRVNPEQYLRFIKREKKFRFANYFGPADALRKVTDRFGKAFLKGQTAAALLFSPG